MNTENTLPIYSKLNHSTEFQLAFMHTGTQASVDCICGRIHVGENYPLDDEEDEVEKERLERLVVEQPEKYISHPDGPSYFHSNDRAVVFGCPCNYAGFLEDLINEHASSIMNYLVAVSTEQKNSVDDFHNQVEHTKKSIS